MTENEDLSAREIATLYIAQNERWVNEGKWVEGEISALTVWESLITKDPERAWPVFLEIITQRSDDETLYQVGHRLHLLLHRHWDAFHERAHALVRDTPRFAKIVGDEIFNPDHFREKSLDVEELIRAHEVLDRHHHNAYRLEGFIESDSQRALDLAIEIIHRGPSHGLGSYDTFSPLHDLLRKSGNAIIDRVEESARESYLVRRCLWRMIPSQRGSSDSYKIPGDVWQRVLIANANTTDWSDDIGPQPQPRQLSPLDESILTAWFAYHMNFWAFETMSDLVDEEPETAWPILLKMLARAEDEERIANLAAGPLEDLLTKHGEALFERIADEARRNDKLREALEGVWVFPDDDIYDRYITLMEELRSDQG